MSDVIITVIPKTKGGLEGAPTSATINIGTTAAGSSPNPTLPPNITGLHVVNQGEGNLWVTQDLPLTWNAITTQAIDPSLPAGAYFDQNFMDYVVDIFNADGVTRRRREILSINSYSYAYTKNFQDGGVNGAASSVIIRVYAQDKNGSLSATPATLAVSNTGTGSTLPPSAPTGLTVAGTKLNIYITWNIQPDPSVINYEVNISTNGGSTWTQYYTSSEIYTFPGAVGTTYTVRLRSQSYTGLFSPYTATTTGTLAGINGGTDIVAGTITADRIVAGSITATQIAAYTIDISRINFSVGDVTVTALAGGLVITGGGITLYGGGAFKGGQTDYNTGTGFFLGYSGTAYKFSIGNPSGQHLTYDGSVLSTMFGDIYAYGMAYLGVECALHIKDGTYNLDRDVISINGTTLKIGTNALTTAMSIGGTLYTLSVVSGVVHAA